MDWIELVKYLSIFLTSISAFSVVAVYLGKRILDKSLELGNEKFKGELNKELETHKKNYN